jgi:hypothetical protein
VEPIDPLKLYCSIQGALLGKITPNLRAVFAKITSNSSFDLSFYYDHLTEEDEELASLADTEVIADFPAPEFKSSCKIQQLSFPNKLPQEGKCLYYRFEN